MTNSKPHSSQFELIAATKRNMIEKILYFNEQDESPAVQQLLSSLVMRSNKAHKPIRTGGIKKLRLLLPKLKDFSLYPKSLNNSIQCSVNNSFTSIQQDNLKKIQLIDIPSKDFNQQRLNFNSPYLQEVEQRQNKFDFLEKFRRNSRMSQTKRSSEQGNGSINIMNNSIKSTSIQPSTKLELSSIQGAYQQLYNEQLADYETLRQFCDEDNILLLNYFETNQLIILKALRYRDYVLVIKVFGEALEICQVINKLKVFSQIVYYLACVSYDCDQIHTATFFLEQTLIICEYTKNHKLKLRVLQQLANCASKFQMFQQAIDLLKKSLIYAWITNDFEQEIQSYDMLGLNYFYKGDIKQAITFHEKYTLAEVEPQGGYFRKTAQKFVTFYEEKLEYFSQKIDQTFMIKLSLPIKNKFETETDRLNAFCDQYKVIRYDKCNGIAIIDKIVVGIEFTQYFLEYYKTQLRDNSLPKQKVTTTRLPIKIIKIQQKYSDFKTQYSFSHNICQNELYNIPLNIRVQARVQKAHELDTIWGTIQKSVGSNRSPFGERSEQIFMKHLAEMRIKKETLSIFLKRNRDSINKIIVSIAQAKN